MVMKNEIELLKIVRQRLLDLVVDKELDYLLEIPQNFNNNIFWNAAHCVVTQQLLQYKLTSTEMKVSVFFIDHFRKGTNARDVEVGERELIDLKEYLVKTPLWLEEDYANEAFGKYIPYKTSFGLELSTLEDAIRFNNVHEGIHLGYSLAIKKALL